MRTIRYKRKKCIENVFEYRFTLDMRKKHINKRYTVEKIRQSGTNVTYIFPAGTRHTFPQYLIMN